jgi:LAO/AO transport system kinase
LPNAGDELQGIKKGIMELADALVINKADGESINLAAMTRKHYTAAMTLLRHALHWSPQVMTCSALEGENIDAVWDMVTDFEQTAKAEQVFQARRDGQSRDWMHHLINELLHLKLDSNPAARSLLPALEQQVVAREITPYAAARKIIDCL